MTTRRQTYYDDREYKHHKIKPVYKEHYINLLRDSFEVRHMQESDVPYLSDNNKEKLQIEHINDIFTKYRENLRNNTGEGETFNIGVEPLEREAPDDFFEPRVTIPPREPRTPPTSPRESRTPPTPPRAPPTPSTPPTPTRVPPVAEPKSKSKSKSKLMASKRLKLKEKYGGEISKEPILKPVSPEDTLPSSVSIEDINRSIIEMEQYTPEQKGIDKARGSKDDAPISEAITSFGDDNEIISNTGLTGEQLRNILFMHNEEKGTTLEFVYNKTDSRINKRDNKKLIETLLAYNRSKLINPEKYKTSKGILEKKII